MNSNTDISHKRQVILLLTQLNVASFTNPGASSLLRTLQNLFRLSPTNEWRWFASYTVYEDVRMCSPTPPEDRGMISTAHCQDTFPQMLFFPGSLSPLFRVSSPRPREDRFYFPLCWVSLVLPCFLPPLRLIDLAPFESEAGAPDTVSTPPCLCICIPLSLCVERECQEDAWTLGPSSCGKISQEAPPPLPPSSILQREKERRKARGSRGSFTINFTEAWGGGRKHVTLVQTHTLVRRSVFPVVISYPGHRVDLRITIWRRTSLLRGCRPQRNPD